MTLRKKSASSTETSASSSSTSSSSDSSSSSGSESSSSDTENSSTSHPSTRSNAKSNASTDSEAQNPKKSGPVTTRTASDETRRKATKAPPTRSKANYSSESEESAKTAPKKRPLSKPKPTATPVPVPKATPSHRQSSRSTTVASSAATHRSTAAAPSAATHRSTAAASNATGHRSTAAPSNSAGHRSTAAASNAASHRSTATASNAATHRSATAASSAAGHRSAAVAAGHKTPGPTRNTGGDDQKVPAASRRDSPPLKKQKTRSIFSPENSSESDDQAATAAPLPKLSSPPVNKGPPKPTPAQRGRKGSTALLTSNALVAAGKASHTPSDKSGHSTNSSASSTSSGSSESSSDSESSANASATTKANNAGARPAPRPQKAARVLVDSTTAPPSESDGDMAKAPVTRKLTRSTSVRKSRHVGGRTSDQDSDTDNARTVTKEPTTPVKKPVVRPSPSRKKQQGKGAAGSKPTTLAAIEERHCPVPNCDSLGHLGGRLERHFTQDACPIFHNTTKDACKEAYAVRMAREEERQKALQRSPRHAATAEQRMYLQRVREARSQTPPTPPEDEPPGSPTKNREPYLGGLTPDYDLQLFREAQAAASEKIEEDLKGLPDVKGIKYIEMGKFEMEVWYQSPYPDDYARQPKLYLCEYCLRYMKSRTVLKRHAKKCVWRHPPGEEVYRKDKIAVWEVDGKRYKQYCQNLCLLAKFFLDHKTLYYDVEPFLFYVMTIADSEGCHTVGYFSKEKKSFLNYNVSCILTLPPYQRQGYGRLLIDFSYLLTRVEGKVGSPEKPLSDLGLISYRSHWQDVLLDYLCKFGGKDISVKDMSQEMAINSYDIVSTLQALGMMKYWKGRHIILKKQDVIEEYQERVKRRGSAHKEIEVEYLRWKPYQEPQSPQS